MTSEFLSSLISLSITSLAFAVVAGCIAQDKGRRVAPWAIVCVIPLVNFFCILYLVASTNLRLERKLDAALALLRLSAADGRARDAMAESALRSETVL